MCRVLEVSTSGYYAWRQRQPSARAQADQNLSKRIGEIHQRSQGTRGTPCPRSGPAQFHSQRSQSIVGGRYYLRCHLGWLVIPGGRRGRLEPQGSRMGDVYPTAYHPGSGCLAHGDPTTPSARCHSSLRPGQSVHLPGLRSALSGCRRASLHGLVGDCYDNALGESFFATLECELLDRHTFHTQAEARLAVFAFIEGWYNPHRRHSALDYLSPNRYEALHAHTPQTRKPPCVH